MTDVQGWRAKFGVIGPSTNTIVQPDMELMRPRGVTNHYSRIYTPNANAISNETFMAGTLKIAENVKDAVKSVVTCEPDYLVMGMSAITFYGGKDGAHKFVQDVEEASGGVKCSTGSLSCTAALKAYGGVKRISFLSPYYPVANAEVRQYFTDEGFEVVNDVPMQAPSWTGIAEITEDQLRDAFREIDGDDVDALVQVGTNCSTIHMAAALEKVLDKPVIAINTATYWNALRTCGIDDKIDGLGRLLSEF